MNVENEKYYGRLEASKWDFKTKFREKKNSKIERFGITQQKLIFILNYKLLDFKLFFKSIYI